MKPPVFEYRAPRTEDEALAFLAEAGDDGRILAGGQSLVPLLNFRMARPAVLIDLNRCAGLSYLHLEGDELVIGPMTRQAEAEFSPLVREHCPLLADALPHMGHLTIRNRGTIGGNLAHADPGAELPAVAMALNAQMIVTGAGARRSLTTDDFFIDSLVTAIEPGEMLREIRFPTRRPGDRHAFVESGVRRADLAIAGVAAYAHVASEEICDSISLVALGGGTRPTRLVSVENALRNRAFDGIDPGEIATLARADVDPPSDLQAGSDYRRDLLTALTRTALTKLFAKEARA
jgi:CO/xanthine dehydrogenase FAD-binding subunit